MSRPLKWGTHADLAIVRNPDVGREEFLDHMTFQRNDRPLFTELFGPLLGLKEEWEEQGAGPQELDFSVFRYEYPPFQTDRVVILWRASKQQLLSVIDEMFFSGWHGPPFVRWP